VIAMSISSEVKKKFREDGSFVAARHIRKSLTPTTNCLTMSAETTIAITTSAARGTVHRLIG
jgi:hypothetical protein